MTAVQPENGREMAALVLCLLGSGSLGGSHTSPTLLCDDDDGVSVSPSGSDPALSPDARHAQLFSLNRLFKRPHSFSPAAVAVTDGEKRPKQPASILSRNERIVEVAAEPRDIDQPSIESPSHDDDDEHEERLKHQQLLALLGGLCGVHIGNKPLSCDELFREAGRAALIRNMSRSRFSRAFRAAYVERFGAADAGAPLWPGAKAAVLLKKYGIPQHLSHINLPE